PFDLLIGICIDTHLDHERRIDCRVYAMRSVNDSFQDRRQGTSLLKISQSWSVRTRNVNNKDICILSESINTIDVILLDRFNIFVRCGFVLCDLNREKLALLETPWWDAGFSI